MVHKTKIKKLKNDLKGISKKVVAERTGKSATWIHAVLNGDCYDENVIKACVEYRDELKARSVELAEKI